MGDVRVTSKNISQIHNGSQCRRFLIVMDGQSSRGDIGEA